MSDLRKTITRAAPGSGIQFRRNAYGKRGVRDFLRDVLALANASVDGKRYLVVGVDADSDNRKVYGVDQGDFTGKPDYVALVADYIEPAVRIHYEAEQVDGKRIGVFEIADCQDRPYMMRVDFDETLRRGDAYVRINDASIKMGRRQLQELFEQTFRDSVSASDIEFGFPGDIIHKQLRLRTCDLTRLPSAQATEKLKALIQIRKNSRNSGSTSLMARLMHARLYGSDDPYVVRTPDELMQELGEIRGKYENEDKHFLFEEQAQKLQFVVCNRGNEAIRDAQLKVVMPNHESLYIAPELPKLRRNGDFIDRNAAEQELYPTVVVKGDAVQISCRLGDIQTGEPVMLFDSPVRLCVGRDLAGRKFGLRYALVGENLRRPAKGTLRIQFAETVEA